LKEKTDLGFIPNPLAETTSMILKSMEVVFYLQISDEIRGQLLIARA
jgi:hypothetical protein